MPRRINYQKTSVKRRPTYLRQWREYRILSLETLADRLDMSGAQLSRIERGLSPYTQDFLEGAAVALSTDVPSLLMRDPTKEDPADPGSMWSLWDRAKPGERRTIVEHAKIVIKTGT